MNGPAPLAGVSVLDFTTLLPGPLATLMLAEAGADVLKVEHPEGGDPIRQVGPFTADGTSVRFLLLNRGKRSISLDLKSEDGRARAHELALAADVVVEQFRPGVMDRLGLGFSELSRGNPGLIYCSVTGYGQTGPKAGVAGHDLNYAADSGILSLVLDGSGSPTLPPATFADVGGGSYPAVMNILLALIGRRDTGHGAHLDIAMSENLFPFEYWGVGNGLRGRWPQANGELLTGGSPRYAIYETSDGGHLAVAALEERFWQTFCAVIGVPESLRDDRPDPEATRGAVAERIAGRATTDWERELAGIDVCVNVVRSLEAAVHDAHISARGVFERQVGIEGEGEAIDAMHVPIDPGLRGDARRRDAPQLRDN